MLSVAPLSVVLIGVLGAAILFVAALRIAILERRQLRRCRHVSRGEVAAPLPTDHAQAA